MIRYLAIAALFAAPAIVHADEATPPQPPREKKICRQAVNTGSIMAKRVCHTKAEWDAMEAASRANLDRTRDADNARGMVTR